MCFIPHMNVSSQEPEMLMFLQMTGSQLNSSCKMEAAPCDVGTEDAQPRLPTFSTAARVRVILTFILCTISAVCNLAVLWAASADRRKSHVRTLVMHLSAADLLVTFIVMPLDAAWNITVQWLAGDAACRLLMFLKLLAMYSSAFVTVVISLDRQAAILNPLAIGEARRKCKSMLGIAWLMSALLSIPQVGGTLPHVLSGGSSYPPDVQYVGSMWERSGGKKNEHIPEE